MKSSAGIRSDAELARMLDISPSSLSNFKRRGHIPVNLVVKFGEHQQVSLDYLFFGNKSTFAKSEQNVNLNIMKEVIEVVEDIFQKKNLRLAPKKKADLIVLIYQETLEDESKKSSVEHKVGRLLDIVRTSEESGARG